MDPRCWCSLFYIVLTYIAIVSAQDGDNTTYPECVNATCPTISIDCRTAALDFTSIPTELYSRNNVICLNKIRPRVPIYQLTGCSDTFSSTIATERTEGVCTNETKSSQGTPVALFLNVSQTVVGLYNFSCFTQSNNYFISNYVIMVNDTNTYRDILVFVNGNIQGTANSLVNVNINEGDNLTIIARAVGEVTAVEVAYANSTGFELAANETNFSCNTGFPCGTEYSDDNLDNRYQLCTLTNAAAVTDNQTLRFVVQYNETGQNIITELGEVNVTVYPPTPSTSTTIITNSPTPTDSPIVKDGGNNTAVIVVVVVVIVMVLITIILLLSLTIFLVYCRGSHKASSSLEEHTGSKAIPDGGIRKMRILIYSCDHINVDLLVNKLKENRDFEVEELTDDPPSQLSDNVLRLHSEISQGSVLIDCSCPGGVHSTLHTVVKSYTQKPSGDPESSRWQIIQLNNCEIDAETSPSWSKLYDYIDVMDYDNLDVVVDHVEHKLIEYSHSRTLSIHSSENEENVSVKHHLLPEQKERRVGASGQNTTNEQIEILGKVEGLAQGLAQGIESLATQSAVQHKELVTSVKYNKKQVQKVATQVEAIVKDTRTLVNNSQQSE